MCVVVIAPVREIMNEAPEPGHLVGGVLLVVPCVDDHHVGGLLLVLLRRLVLGRSPPSATEPVPAARPRRKQPAYAVVAAAPVQHPRQPGPDPAAARRRPSERAMQLGGLDVLARGRERRRR